MAGQEVSALNQQIALAEADRTEKEARLAAAKAQLAHGGGGEDIGETLQSDTIRNLRAQEQQFLAIMKQAHTVAEVLAVTKELSQVRGEIERADAEFRNLQGQIDMSQISIRLTSEVSSTVHWAPGSSVKSAFSLSTESPIWPDWKLSWLSTLPLPVLT